MENNYDKEHATEITVGEEEKGLISQAQQANYYKIVFKDSQIHDFSSSIEKSCI